MNQKQIYNKIVKGKENQIKGLAILLDPDKIDFETLPDIIHDCILNKISYFFVGGSLISNHQLADLISFIKKYCDIPVVLFPGNSLHIEPSADAILLLSLISGRNPEFLIGHHVISAPILKKSGLEIISTGYILVDSGQQTTVSYISNTTPVPHNKPEIAACTAMAGEMLGMSLIYLDGGSGAKYPISAEMITKVKQSVDLPIIVGGGINSIEKAKTAFEAGADIVVIGNKIEQDPNFISDLGKLLNNFQSILV
ncbi:MAG: geranylgeranylglyceryl/heptaprenylglyceryl phosphate synthase [Bacteroidota bacterium]